MSEDKFTKGDWIIGVNHEIYDDSAASNCIANVEIWDQKPWVSDANLRLISKAPKMHKALKLAREGMSLKLVDVVGDGNKFEDLRVIIDELLDEISKG